MDKKQFLVLLGKYIVKLRQQKGWTQSELSRNCDKDRQSIERLEKGKINPSAYYLYQIAEGLGMEFEDLLESIKKLHNNSK